LGGPARRSLGNRSPGSASACSAARDERSGSRRPPSRQPVLRWTMPTPSGLGSAIPWSSDRRTVGSRGRRRWLQVGRSAHPAPPARRSARPRLAASISRSSVGHLAEHLPERGRALASRFASARPLSAASKGVERGGGVAVPPLSRSSSAAGRGSRATPARWGTPGRAAPGGRNLRLGAQPNQSRRPVTRVEASYPGRFRTMNWAPNAEAAPNASGERPAGGPNPGISRLNGEWRGPESNRGHHDFQAVAIAASRRHKPHKRADDALASAWLVPVDADRCVEGLGLYGPLESKTPAAGVTAARLQTL
jgi:hypothetical protein